ncbi:Avirulence (Avh) protein [Phytophthora megakarya]|uniref:RxLR effector protein n=1 Tax=Phytophthora megakarya TaxID=4795 RepID=A0A225VV98_9STRA|nr:Avirulence (Avh) protein [Phytophthora megakarya]
MRLSQVLVVVAASFLFASETIAVTIDSNQAKISTVAHGGPNQRLLRRYKEPVDEEPEDDEEPDDLNNLQDLEERGKTEMLKDLANSWGKSYDDIINSVIRLTDDEQKAWIKTINNAVAEKKKTSRDAYNANWRRENGYGRRV